MASLAPVVCISHGGGPMPVLGDASHASIVRSLQTRVPELLKLGTTDQPRAIVLVTAHWSTETPTVSSAKEHKLLYDYYGFPKAAYELKYKAPGSPEVADMVHQVLKDAGFAAQKDATRGWDHGVFIPMMLIHPEATVPIVQISVLGSENPQAHFRLGRALSTLRSRNIAIIGSGFASFHNLRTLFSGTTRIPSFQALNREWSGAVTNAVQTEGLDERAKKFEEWRKWPGAFEMHPRGGAEHFMPLIVCSGAGGPEAGKAFKDEFMGLDIWSYYWT